MRIPPKLWRVLGIGLAVLLGAVLVVRQWVVPAMIARALESRYEGKVSVGGWWLGGSSSGITNLSLHEGPGADSPVWATAKAIETDLSLGGLLSGRAMPGKITLRDPEIHFRLAEDGKPLTKPPLKGGGGGGGGGGKLPDIVVEGAKLTIEQAGRPAMVVSNVAGKLTSAAREERLHADADDPTWGKWSVLGLFDPTFKTGTIRLASTDVRADAEKVASLPFVPKEVWANIVPTGPVDIHLQLTLDQGAATPVAFHADVDLKRTTAVVKGLDLTATDTTGTIAIDGGRVTVKDIKGKAIGGSVAAPRGTLDFTKPKPTFDVRLDLAGVKIAEAPPKWQLNEVGVTSGSLTGHADLKAVLADGVDLTGTTGEAVITGGTMQGFPVKSLTLALTAQGGDLQYESKADAAALGPIGPRRSHDEALTLSRGERGPELLSLPPGADRGEGTPRNIRGPSPHPNLLPGGEGTGLLPLPPGEDRGGGHRGMPMTELTKVARVTPALIALQNPQAPKAKAGVKVGVDEPAKKGGLRLPKSISTQIELEDVDLKSLVQKAGAMGIHVPVAVAGKLSLKAKATIPLGNLRDIKDYTFRGAATLNAASIAGVDLGHVQAKLDLDKGVLDLTDFRGQLVDLPDGGVQGRHPEATPPVPAEGPLPPGGFRGRLHAELSPPGHATAKFEAVALPAGELAAPYLPKPTPLTGHVSLDVDAAAEIATISDPKSWTASGHARSERITYQGTTLDAASTSFALKGGRVEIPDLAARLGGRPMAARLSADLAAPHSFDGRLDVTDWDISDVLALVPTAPKPAPADGVLTIHAEGRGTLAPMDLKTAGNGRIAQFRAGAVPLGDVPFDWKTEGNVIHVVVADARPFGGRLSADARIPAKGDGPIRGAVRAADIDTAQMAAQIPGGNLQLTGKAGGTLDLLVPPHPGSAARAVEANLKLTAPDLTIQGIPAEKLTASIWARKGVVHYDVFADSLGGKIKLSGDVPLAPAPPPGAGGGPGDAAAGPRPARQLEGEVRAVGIALDGLWKGLKLESLAPLGGEGSVHANVRVPLDPPGVFARAVAEVRDLRWGSIPLGRIKGTIAMTPAALRITPLEGELLGSPVTGGVWSEATAGGGRRSNLELAVDSIDLARATASLPGVAHRVAGFGKLRVAGRIDDGGIHAHGEAAMAEARIFGLPIRDFLLPAEVTVAPGTGSGLVRIHHWSARLAGGRVEGDARINLGQDRGFSGGLRLNGIDLETLTRLETGMRHPAAGRITGTASFSGRDYLRRRGLRGRIDLDLDDASLFEVPVFRELGRFLGAAQGGVFEDGDLHATLGERELNVEQLTLEGRVVQIHASGTVGYDQALNLEVLVNTAQVIPETGQALARIIPGLGQAVGRRSQAVSAVGNFLSNRLLKFRVTGTLRAPVVNADATVLVGEAAVGFFGGVLKLPLAFFK